MKRIRAVLLMGLVCVASAFASVMVTSTNIQRLGPYFTSSVGWDSVTGAQVGGQVIYALSADSEKVGDVVYWSSDNHVSKSATLANYNAVAGVVVGGARVSMKGLVGKTDVGTLVATANQRIVILIQGRAWVGNDAGGTLASGALIQASTATAGKVMAKPAALDSLDRVIGRVGVGGSASTTIVANINIK